MAGKISRNYLALTTFLRSVLENPKATLKLKMQAAERLSELYARKVLIEEKQAARAERQRLIEAGLPLPSKLTGRAPKDAPTVEEPVAPELAAKQAKIDEALGWVPRASRS
jgi:hypothetical protein